MNATVLSMGLRCLTTLLVCGYAIWCTHDWAMSTQEKPLTAIQLAAEGWVNAGSYAAWQAWKLEESKEERKKGKKAVNGRN